jgi:formylglycine-generating enzyme required for sulfatase activity
VVEVDWFDAQAFCNWVGCRLPTAKEWEKGARGTARQRYPWGDDWESDRCNTKEANIGDTTPVSRYVKGASPYGLLDMSGNVYGWCEDWSDELCTKKVLKGGSWLNSQIYAQPESQGSVSPSDWGRDIGFRCCLSGVA